MAFGKSLPVHRLSGYSRISEIGAIAAAQHLAKTRDSKSEIRNNFKMIQKHKIPNEAVSDFGFSLSNSVCFGFRYSNFEFGPEGLGANLWTRSFNNQFE